MIMHLVPGILFHVTFCSVPQAVGVKPPVEVGDGQVRSLSLEEKCSEVVTRERLQENSLQSVIGSISYCIHIMYSILHSMFVTLDCILLS